MKKTDNLHPKNCSFCDSLKDHQLNNSPLITDKKDITTANPNPPRVYHGQVSKFSFVNFPPTIYFPPTIFLNSKL